MSEDGGSDAGRTPDRESPTGDRESSPGDREPPPTDRESPVGQPVVRGDAAVTGQSAAQAKAFDPTDPESVAEAAETVARFAENTAGAEDNVFMLRGAAACAALVRGEGSYKAAAERAGDGVTVAFIRKWARVHDLPQSIRRYVAMGHVAPTAAKHIARVGGEDRFQLAWAVLDGDLTVREVRSVASAVNAGTPVEDALADHGVRPGRLTLSLPTETYRELRRTAAMEGKPPEEVVAEALDEKFS
ncbi:hypothetical protein M0R89_08505 [Halorussus limi]|uniref:DUF7119 domain-containing protein n=1 Tax=Halorussus limi TaxID=2938695 RepID=A0A8U0HZ57_9EURY|nr:hypothetical protein [Halorussus limi]UPV76083.1 hypothetical protein M0R89_08505 [Halorussus limi]